MLQHRVEHFKGLRNNDSVQYSHDKKLQQMNNVVELWQPELALQIVVNSIFVNFLKDAISSLIKNKKRNKTQKLPRTAGCFYRKKT